MDKIDRDLLLQVADLHKIPLGSFSIRKNGSLLKMNSTTDIQIVPKPNKRGIDIYVKENVKNKSLHIPVIITQGNLNDVVENDFHIAENCDITIVAGCGIHNDSGQTSTHNGIHTFNIGKNSKVKYIEKHLGVGSGSGGKILNPVTNINMKEDSCFEMQTIQLGGVTSSKRETNAVLQENAKLVVNEKILTTESQWAITGFVVNLQGKNSSCEITSRSVAKNSSTQTFESKLLGNNECFGHVECDGIILDNAKITSNPSVVAGNVNATLIHEAAIGKIAGEQLLKLQTLGLTREEAEAEIIKGFLR